MTHPSSETPPVVTPAPDVEVKAAIEHIRARPKKMVIWRNPGEDDAAYMRRRLDERSEPELNTGCILWWGATDHAGYGRIKLGYKDVSAHRAAYMYANGGESPPCVLHKCDTPQCINPNHLFGGTHKDNMADKHAKGRFKPGTPVTDLEKLVLSVIAPRLSLRRCAEGLGRHTHTLEKHYYAARAAALSTPKGKGEAPDPIPNTGEQSQ